MLRVYPMALMYFLLAGCDKVENSEYQPDPKQKKDIEKKIDDEAESGLSTGVPQCVADYMDANDREPVVPPKLTVTLEKNFPTKDKINSVDDWTNLVDLLLRENVETNGLVDYQKLGKEHDAHLQIAADSLQTIAVPSSSVEAQVAFWTNVYNILMIKMVVQHDLDDISEKFDVFKQEHSIAGHSLTLDQIEKGILGLAGRKEPFPEKLKVDKVIEELHFALVCAAKSCPKIRNFAYREENITDTLDENMLMFFNSELHISTQDGIKVSNLFRWFPDDFDSLAGGVQGLYRRNLIETQVISNCRDDKEELVTAFESTEFKNLEIIAYDWQVNSQ